MTFCFFFFFSSRRRHTRFDCDWSSDVCSSDLFVRMDYGEAIAILERAGEKFEFPVSWGIDLQSEHERYRSEERRVGKGVDLGGRRIIKKKKKKERECSDE